MPPLPGGSRPGRTCVCVVVQRDNAHDVCCHMRVHHACNMQPPLPLLALLHGTATATA